jgi:thiosulfate/3-mercaptopyruvate sulfurtransferase
MAFTTLIDAADLVRNLGRSDWAIVDCRFSLEDTSWGEHQYRTGHVPGAVYAHLDRDLSGEKTGANGRHPLPRIADLIETFGRLGVGDGVQVVAYDQDSGMYASRCWWMLRWMGHERVAVLDGGWTRWLADGHPSQEGQQPAQARVFTGAPRSEMVASAADVAAMLHARDRRLVDVRAPERFRGDIEAIDRVAGHIPGATNHFFRSDLNEDGTFRPPGDLRERWSHTLAGVRPEGLVCYCGSGVTACHSLLALEHAGLQGARLYPGSWSEWSSDPSRPTARG